MGTRRLRRARWRAYELGILRQVIPGAALLASYESFGKPEIVTQLLQEAPAPGDETCFNQTRWREKKGSPRQLKYKVQTTRSYGRPSVVAQPLELETGGRSERRKSGVGKRAQQKTPRRRHHRGNPPPVFDGSRFRLENASLATLQSLEQRARPSAQWAVLIAT